MSTLSRAGLSFACAIAADVLVGTFVSLRIPAATSFSDMVGFVYFSLYLIIPGWLIALPIILTVTSFQGWRLFGFLAVGSMIGPALIACIGFFFSLKTPISSSFAHEAYHILYAATAVSELTSILYISLMRASQRSSPKVSR